MLNLKSLKIILTLLGWLTVQSSVLAHEFSEEHWFSSTNHVCLTQATHLDDLLPTSTSEVTVDFNQVFILSESKQNDVFSKRILTSRHTRAPPTNS